MKKAKPVLPILCAIAFVLGCEALLPPPPVVDAGAPPAVKEPPAPPPEAAAVTAIVGGTVFDGTGAEPLADAVVLLKKDRVEAVGPRSSVKIPEGALTIDAKGKWVVPGLIDTHVHFFQSGGVYTRPDIVDLTAIRPYAEEVAWIKENLESTFRRTLRSGVTAVVDVGGPMWNFEVRDRAREIAYAPRVAVAGPLISTVERPQLDAGDPPIIRAESPEAARALVRKQLEKKPDLIKVWFIVTEERGVEATIEMLRAVVDESHRAGVRVAVHATELAAARASVEAGAEILVHSIDDAEIDDALIAKMKEQGTIVCPTLAVMEGYAEVLGQAVETIAFERQVGDPDVIRSWSELAVAGVGEPEQAAARAEKLAVKAPVMAANLRKLIEAGVTIAMGTDAGNIGTLHGASVHREIELMAEAGMTPRQILLAATRDAAKVFSTEPEIGTIEKGRLADLLVLDADPLADARNLTRIDRIVKGGAVMVPDRIQPPNPAWVVQQQVDAYNARDVERFVSWFAEDALVGRFPEGDGIARGRDEIRRLYSAMFEKSPALSCRIVRRSVQGRYVIDRELVTGIRGGADVRAIAIYEVEDGRIARVWFLPKE